MITSWASMGRSMGWMGKGGGKEEFAKKAEEKSLVRMLEGSLDALVQYEN